MWLAQENERRLTELQLLTATIEKLARSPERGNHLKISGEEAGRYADRLYDAFEVIRRVRPMDLPPHIRPLRDGLANDVFEIARALRPEEPTP